MKKTYQNPTTKIVKIQTMQMIAQSVGVGSEYQSGNAVLSRRGNSWDDEDDYDE